MSKTDEDDQDELDKDARVVKFLKLKCLQQKVCACARTSCTHNRKYWASFMFYSFKNAAPSDHFKYGTITAVARTLKMDEDDVETMLEDVQQEVENLRILFEQGSEESARQRKRRKIDRTSCSSQSLPSSIRQIISKSTALIKENADLKMELFTMQNKLNAAECKNKRLQAIHQFITISLYPCI